MPALEGRPIRLRFQPELTVERSKLLSRRNRGRPVHAASFVRRREMILDAGLLRRRGELRRIILHELFHFAWLRLGNFARWSYERLLDGEIRRGVSGELGWSAQWRKDALRPADRERRTRRWREYACESFCDTGAWLYAGPRRHSEHTLERRASAKRLRWFRQLLPGDCIPI